MKPLIELVDTVEIITEGKDSKDLYLKGISIQAEIVNGNGRKYPIAVVESALSIYQPKIANNTATGELDHPTENIHKIDPDRISHIFTEIIKDGSNFVTKAKILNTTCGTQVKNLIEGGVKLGMSSRGLGKTKMETGVAIVEKLHFVTLADIVVNPSAPDAWQQAINENKEWVFENGVLVEKDVEPIIDETKQILENSTPEQRSVAVKTLFQKYLDTIQNKN